MFVGASTRHRSCIYGNTSFLCSPSGGLILYMSVFVCSCMHCVCSLICTFSIDSRSVNDLAIEREEGQTP